MELLFATNNKHKLIEIKQLLNSNINILSLSDIGIQDVVNETGKTFEENALLKAKYYYEKTRLNVFADDSGLEVYALNNEPSIYSSRYAGEEGNDKKNIIKLLNKLENITDRRAQFRCCIALILNNKEYFFEGIVKGHITTKPLGNNGFGYDPIFIPEGYDITFAQMTLEQKNQISHRSIAIKKLANFLNSLHELV